MRIRRLDMLTLVILSNLVVLSLTTPVFADHSYLGWTIEHTSKTFEEFEIDYRNYGATIKKINADIADKKILLDVQITATPAFLEIDLPRNLLDARDADSIGDFTIIYDGNRAGFDEVETSLSYRTLNIQLRGASTAEHIEIEIIGTHIFEELSLPEAESKPKSEPTEKLKSEKAKQQKPDKDKKTKDEVKPKADLESIQMIGPVQMIEFIEMMTPEQKTKPPHKIQLKEVLQLNGESEPKQELKPKPLPSAISISSNRSSNLVGNTNLANLKPELKLEQVVSTKLENDTLKEDNCFICKNKKKLENKKPQFEQLQASVVLQKAEIESKGEINFLNEILTIFQGFFQRIFG